MLRDGAPVDYPYHFLAPDSRRSAFTKFFDSFSAADCPRGTFSSNGECKPCAAGQYQDQQGRAACKDCRSGTSSVAGANDANQCRGVYMKSTHLSCFNHSMRQSRETRSPCEAKAKDQIGT